MSVPGRHLLRRDGDIKNLNLQSKDPNTTGGCLYGGSLAMNTVLIGNTDGTFLFTAGGIISHPNGANNKRTLTISNSMIAGNFSPWEGGGVRLIGWVETTISNIQLDMNTSNESGGGIFWYDQGLGKMGFLKVSGGDITYDNATGGSGGGIYISGVDSTAFATLSNLNFQQNSAQLGGGLYVSDDFPVGKVNLAGIFVPGNDHAQNDNQQAFLDLAAYNAIWCTKSSNIWLGDFFGNRWEWANSPPLRGDGTCTFPQ